MQSAKMILKILSILLLTSCSSTQLADYRPSADPRIEQAPMTAETKSVARDYFDNKPNPKAFAFSPEKGTNWAAWGSSSLEAAKELAMRECEKRTRTRCVFFAVDDQIVWQPVSEIEVAEPDILSPRYAIQVAAVRDAAEIPDEWQRLANRYQALGALELQAPRTFDVPGKGTFYRVIAGAFATRAEALSACGQLRRQGGECWVVAL